MPNASVPAAAEGLPTRKKIPECLRKKNHGTDGIDALNFAMDLLRVTAIALVEAKDGALSEADIRAAGYCTMYAIDALKVTCNGLDGEAV